MRDSSLRSASLSEVLSVVFLLAALVTAPAVWAADGDGGTTPAADAAPDAGAAANGALATITITAQRLNEVRQEIETRTGASTYTITSDAIAATPGGENVQMNQVLLQAPGVVQDSFGQLHVRGDHNDLQYRLNGIILPEGISVFSQTLSPRLISSLSLITGALPAEYGLRTAGVIDLSTNSGLLQPGGTVSVYGGSFGTFEPAAEYGGRSGGFSYYMTGDYKVNNLGIESPDGSANPLHDHSTQGHGFAYLEDILDPNNRLSLILGTSDDAFEIPNQRGLQPGSGLTVNGQTMFLSDNLNETQHEAAQYAILSWQHSQGALNWQTSLSARYTTLHFAPDLLGDLLYNGIAQDAYKSDTAFGWQTDASYQAGDAHTVRAGFYLQHDSAKSNTASQVLPLDPATGVQTTDVPQVVIDNGTQSQSIESVYLQDEWKVLSPLTINYGLRFDRYSAYSSGSQLSPRLNFVWQLAEGTTVHGGYSRYFTPPPFELIGSQTLTKFLNTSALPPGSVTLDTSPIAARANYYDFGIQQKLLDKALTLGVDSFYEQAVHLIDEGQFGAPIILTPFNYRYGLIGGVEFSANYAVKDFSAYGNVSFQAAHGKQWESSQFNFSPADFDYVSQNYIHLDHEGRVAASGGVSYLWLGTRFSGDFLFGTGLRQSINFPNDDHVPSYTQVNLGLSHDFQLTGSGPLTARIDVINVFDQVYQIRSGSGVGVFAPQYGPRRGLFGGVSWQF
ncbi:MAG TPA: TonB-dependent receptor [Steroidobacteraceae bacterium]|jgi:outer membrane receptor protein involved in Fe transport|nr:TonB-dependent receptor [Steroidobacteraceae bacterium]